MTFEDQLQGQIIPNGETAATLVKRMDTESRLGFAEKWSRLRAEFEREQPFDPKKLKELNQSYRVNVNVGEMEALVTEAVASATETVFSPGLLIEAELRTSLPHHGARIDRYQETVASEYTETLMDDCGKDFDFFSLADDAHKDTMLFGFAAAVWPNEYDWRPLRFEIDRFRFPPDAPVRAEEMPLFALYRGIAASELFEKARAGADGWNIPLAKTALLDHFGMGAKPGAETDRGTLYAEMSARYDRGDSTIRADALRDIPVVDLWSADPTSGKVTHMILWMGVPPLPENKDGVEKEVDAIDASIKEGHILFLRKERFESMADALWLMTYDRGSGKLETVRGLGHRAYTHCAFSNRMFCQTADGAVQSASLILVPPEGADHSRIPMTRTGPYSVMAPGWSTAQTAFTPQIQHLIALRSMSSAILHNNVGNYRRRPEDPTARPGDKSATEVQSEISRESETEQGRSVHRFQAWDRMHRRIFKKMLSPKTLLSGFDGGDDKEKTEALAKWMDERHEKGFLPFDEDYLDELPGTKYPGRDQALRFCGRCVLRGVPLPVLLLGRWKVSANRGIGAASRGARVQSLREALSLRGEMPPEKRRVLLRKYVAETTTNTRLAERLFPDLESGEAVTQTISLVAIENAMFRQGSFVPPAEDQPHEEHLEGLAAAFQAGVEEWRDAPRRELADGLNKLFQNGLKHAQGHLQYLAADPFSKDKAREWTQRLAMFAQVASQFAALAAQVAQEQEQQMAALAEENRRLQEQVAASQTELALGMKRLEMEHQVEMAKAQSLHESRVAKTETSVQTSAYRAQADELRKSEQHRLDMERKMRELEADIAKMSIAIQKAQQKT